MRFAWICLVLAACGDAGVEVAPTDHPTGLALQGANVYWTEQDGSIHSAPKDGGLSRTVSAAGGKGARTAIAGGQVYWISDDTLWQAPLAGGPATAVSEQGALTFTIDNVAGRVVWAGFFDVRARPFAGGTTTVLTDHVVATDLAVGDDGTIYFSATSLYFEDPAGAIGVWQLPPGPPGSPEPVRVLAGTASAPPGELALGGGGLYFVAGDEVYLTSLDGVRVTPLGPLHAPHDLTPGDRVLFVASDHTVYALTPGAPPRAVASADDDVRAVAFDPVAKRLYLATDAALTAVEVDAGE
jgi:hypothetical protein